MVQKAHGEMGSALSTRTLQYAFATACPLPPLALVSAPLSRCSLFSISYFHTTPLSTLLLNRTLSSTPCSLSTLYSPTLTLLPSTRTKTRIPQITPHPSPLSSQTSPGRSLSFSLCSSLPGCHDFIDLFHSPHKQTRVSRDPSVSGRRRAPHNQNANLYFKGNGTRRQRQGNNPIITTASRT